MTDDVPRFWLDRDSGMPAYLQIAGQVREAIRFGSLRAGDRLPTVREVAATSGLNPNTVLRAYRDLAADGVLEMRQGLGTFVAAAPAATDPHLLLRWRRRVERLVGQALDAGLTPDDVNALLRAVDARAAVRATA